MFRATLYSSSGGQLYEYNFWYNHCVLVAVRCRIMGKNRVYYKMMTYVILLLLSVFVVQLTVLTRTVLYTRQNLLVRAGGISLLIDSNDSFGRVQ
jgi:hypothetical protein